MDGAFIRGVHRRTLEIYIHHFHMDMMKDFKSCHDGAMFRLNGGKPISHTAVHNFCRAPLLFVIFLSPAILHLWTLVIYTRRTLQETRLWEHVRASRCPTTF